MSYTLKRVDVIDNSVAYFRKTVYKTQPIGKVDAPYQYISSREVSRLGSYTFYSPKNNFAFNIAEGYCFGALASKSSQNQAYARMVNEIGDSAQIGANVAEGKSTLRMVGLGRKPKAYRRAYETRNGSLYNGSRQVETQVSRIVSAATILSAAYKDLKRGRFDRFVKTLNIRPELVKRQHRELSVFKPSDKKVADLWLQYHFGWSPLISDMYSAVEVLTTPFPKKKIRGTAKEHYQASGAFANQIYSYDVTARFKSQVTIQMYNPNLYLNARLGLSNPLAIAWEAVPFSFLVDWFGNISDVLNSFTDFDGLDLTRPTSTWSAQGSGRNVLIGDQDCTYRVFLMRRDLVLPTPKVKFALPKRLSVSRAATSVALLVQLFVK